MAAEDWIGDGWEDYDIDEYSPPTKELYPNTEKEWNHQPIKSMGISHCFNTAKLILNKSKELYFIGRQTAKVDMAKQSIFYDKGLKPIKWEQYMEWFDFRFPCFAALMNRIGPELEDMLPGVEWED